MRLLIGLDRREGGRDALELARTIAEPGSSALVVSVLYTGPLPMEFALLPDEEAEDANDYFEDARARLGEIEVETRAYGGGSPAGIITKLAEEGDFDLIVVGSPHRGAIGRVMIGSVATSLLNGAPADVAVAPRGYSEQHHEVPQEIAVGYDGSPEAKVALRCAEALARRGAASIRLITVVRPPTAAPVMVPGVYSPQFPADPDRVLNEGLDSIDPRLAAERVRRGGDPAAQLAAAAEDADLLIVGSRGYGPLARVLLGSVSSQVVTRAHCPVLVARRPA